MSFNKMVLALLSLTVSAFATQEHYLEGMKHYKEKAYDKAFPIILKEAKEDNRAAQYRLADMYENGYGTEVDYKQSSFWFKKAASTYAYIETDQGNDLNLSTVNAQVGNDSIKAGNEYALAKMDTDTPETKKLLRSILDGDYFGLQPYATNYILPISYGKTKPPRYAAGTHVNNITPEQEKYRYYDKNTEVEFQISFKKQLSYDLFGFNEYINFAYTQKVWWQLYAESGPFRETNYLPELFVSVPTSQSIDNAIGLKAVKVGFLHESNGQEGYRSRSWNRVYATGMWQWGNLFVATRAWYRLDEDEKSDGYYDGLTTDPNEKGDDNPDILKYLGYGDIKIDYLYGDSQFGLLWRNNLRMNSDNKGAVELNYSYPVFDSPNTFLYVKLFNGYGESLIDYNRNVTKAAVGFSFSRGLF